MAWCARVPNATRSQELRKLFTDNDSLAVLIALELKADVLLLLSDVQGGPPKLQISPPPHHSTICERCRPRCVPPLESRPRGSARRLVANRAVLLSALVMRTDCRPYSIALSRCTPLPSGFVAFRSVCS